MALFVFDPSFFPDGARATAMDLHMRKSLGSSIRHILARAGHLLTAGQKAAEILLSGLESGKPYPPAAFGLYARLVPTLLEGRIDSAQTLFSDLLSLEPVAQPGELVALNDPDCKAYCELYTELMDAGAGSRAPYLAPNPDQLAGFRQHYGEALAMLHRACPELGREVSALVNQVIMVAGDQESPYQFDGGSCYMLWGGMFINVAMPRSTVALAEVIAHESAHIMLYAFASEEALVENPDEELYPSPLRTDLRPMDGIYHATYVSARMHWAMEQLAASNILDDETVAGAIAAKKADRDNFAAGYSVVEKHGRLTATGNAVMNAAYDYMAQSAE